MNQTHTKGPWIIGSDGDGLTNGRVFSTVKCATGLPISDVYGTNAEAQANARLIAAAPELLAALRETLDELEKLRDDAPHPRPTAESAVCHRAWAAIAKAENP